VPLVITRANRIARNGDIANIIGIYGLVVLARAYKMPYYMPTMVDFLYVDLKIGRRYRLGKERRTRTEIAQFFCNLGLQ